MKLAEKMQFICDKSNLTRGELKLLFDCQKQRIDDLFIPDRVLKLKKQEVDLLALKYKYNPQWLGNDAGADYPFRWASMDDASRTLPF